MEIYCHLHLQKTFFNRTILYKQIHNLFLCECALDLLSLYKINIES
jgi:hypothetical protein